MFSLLCFTVFLILFWFNFKMFLVMQHSLWDLSFPARGWTRPSALKAWSSNHWTAKEVPVFNFIMFLLRVFFSSFLHGDIHRVAKSQTQLNNFHSLTSYKKNCSINICWKAIFYLLSYIGNFSEKQLIIHVWSYFCYLFSVPFINIPNLSQILLC